MEAGLVMGGNCAAVMLQETELKAGSPLQEDDEIGLTFGLFSTSGMLCSQSKEALVSMRFFSTGKVISDSRLVGLSIFPEFMV